MTVTMSCATCRMEKTLELELDARPRTVLATTIKTLISLAKWRFQVNGENLDIYCSARCAR